MEVVEQMDKVFIRHHASLEQGLQGIPIQQIDTPGGEGVNGDSGELQTLLNHSHPSHAVGSVGSAGQPAVVDHGFLVGGLSTFSGSGDEQNVSRSGLFGVSSA